MTGTLQAFYSLTSAIVRGIPRYMFRLSGASLIFWLFAGLVYFQYRRVGATEDRLFGVVKNRPGYQMLKSLGWGALGGVVASVLLVFLGIPLSDSGLAYLFPIALLLMLLSPRLMCFSYSGGIISLSYLAFGFPRVNVPTIMALVAVLHLTESLLIFLSGAGCSTPFFVRNKKNEVVGGFGVQRFWPMPLMAVFLMNMQMTPGIGYIPTPDWWPLLGIKESALINTNFMYVMLPVAAGLGYGDVAVTCSPGERARRTSGILCAYSLILLGLALGSASSRPLMWAAALFGPFGHELVARLGSSKELSGKPLYVRPAEGVMVLDVIPNSAAEAAHLKPGDVVLEVNGRRVNSRDDIAAALGETPAPLELVIREAGVPGHERLFKKGHLVDQLGIIPVPEPGDDVHVELQQRSPLKALYNRLRSLFN